MSPQPKVSNLDQNQKPSYTPLLFDWAPAPLAPQTGKSSISYEGSFNLVPKTNGEINVVDNFNWTLSGPDARKYVTKVLLTEYNQILSSELLGALYGLRGVPSNLISGFKNLGRTAEATAQALGGGAKTSPFPSQGLTSQAVNAAYGEQADKSIEVSTGAAQNIGRADGLSNVSAVLKSAFDPYKNLYTVQQTGFTYVLPYFAEKSMVSVSNTWSKPGNEMKEGAFQAGEGLSDVVGSFIGGKEKEGSGTAGKGDGAAGKGKGLLDFFKFGKGAANVVGGAAKVGAAGGGALTGDEAAEVIKAFRGADAVDSISITFYLYNTFDSDIASIQRNWDLCYLLTYQNLPNRLANNILNPPCLYEIDVPGYKRIPLAYLDTIDISNIGNTRILNLKTGEVVGGLKQNSNCKVIPEAYKVSLSFKSVLKNTRNTFLYTAIPEASINVTIGGAPQ